MGILSGTAGKQEIATDFIVPVNPQAKPSTGDTGAAVAQVTCDILNLDIGRIDLNLLGLEIHIDPISIDIIANPAGGLLGDLLCAIANLLDGGPLAAIIDQLIVSLNQLLDILG